MRIIEIKVKGYANLHTWVRNHLGKPVECWCCGSKSKQRYHWANVSGNYSKDLQDWVSLCVPCHYDFDGRSEVLLFSEACKNGHRLTIDRLYLKTPTDKKRRKYIICRECDREQSRRYKARVKYGASASA